MRFRHPPVVAVATMALSRRLIELAHARRRFGYRRLHDLLRLEFPCVNHKGICRLYREANLAVRKRHKAKYPSALSQPLQAAQRPDPDRRHRRMVEPIADLRKDAHVTWKSGV